ncbi:hypothetical protein K458DRAFT_396784 [Lentithecium fluviatile CBS 122367]|uniref:Extracellular membrane protein CFEM domain-containing protein n=1 Tax=Lentithecium fluviatile CBS 122367 TaxID=1168545 RepID=A0A6G1IF81_9PLEO|nr:hypothetical protein K458DRAFT_396784 [Lentithecium fluviatile CBS 122367]
MRLKTNLCQTTHHLLTTLILIISTTTTNAQTNTNAQDITTVAAYPLQKSCARTCFVRIGSCWDDILGREIGCAPVVCTSVGWQAPNDCYCRPDLQQAAQEHLTSCIRDACTVGDAGVDVSSAGSIYSQYCAEKGFTAAAATTPSSASATVTGSGGAGATSTSTGHSTTEDLKKKWKGLPTGAWIGIGVGICLVLALVGAYFKKNGHKGSAIQGLGQSQRGNQGPFDGPPVFALANAVNYQATHPRSGCEAWQLCHWKESALSTSPKSKTKGEGLINYFLVQLEPS